MVAKKKAGAPKDAPARSVYLRPRRQAQILAHTGREVAQIYKDDGVSGTIPLHERPEGRRLLEDAKEGKFQIALVYKLDRLGRTLLVIVDAHDRLQEAGVALRSATEPIDTSTPSGRLIFQMLASFAEYDRENIRERTQAGLHRAFRGGKHTGCIPYGYDIAKDSSFMVVEEEAAVVREIIANISGSSTLYNLKLLIASVESDLATREQERLAAADAAAWLMMLRERVAELEADTEEARRKQRELVWLLVKRITCRFGPPTTQEADGFSHGVADSLLWYNARS